MDPFSQASLSPGDYYHGGLSPQAQGSSAAMPGGVKLELPPAAQAPTTMQQPGPGPGPRNYKSRKYRPCDFCRARQVACKIEVAPPCQLCQSHRRECTFVEQPKKKRRPPAESAVAPVVVAASSSQGSGSRAATGTPAEGSRVHIGRSHIITSQRHIDATVSEGATQLPCSRTSAAFNARAGQRHLRPPTPQLRCTF